MMLFISTNKGIEVDFDISEVYTAIQVCYRL